MAKFETKASILWAQQDGYVDGSLQLLSFVVFFYGVQCREVCGSTARKWQTWLNSVAREATRARLQDTHGQHLSQQGVNKSLGLWPIKVCIGQAQLLYVAHVARLPLDRPERIALSGWLSELAYNSGKQGSESRRQLCWRSQRWRTFHHQRLHQPGS